MREDEAMKNIRQRISLSGVPVLWKPPGPRSAIWRIGLLANIDIARMLRHRFALDIRAKDFDLGDCDSDQVEA